MMDHGVVHFEIPADDPEKLGEFYKGLFGWSISGMQMGDQMYYAVVTVPTDDKGMPTQPGGINGGMMKRMDPNQTPMNYVNVEEVNQYVEKAKSLGATVMVEKMPVPGMGYFAVLMDPQNNPIGLWQNDTSAA